MSKPEGAIESPVAADLGECSLDDAYAVLCKVVGYRSHYLLRVHPESLPTGFSLVNRYWSKLVVEQDESFTDIDEWTLTAWQFDGEKFTHKTFWSPGA